MKTVKILFLFILVFSVSQAFGQYLSKEKALEDMFQFKEAIEKQSSYLHISDYSYDEDFKKSILEIEKNDSIQITKLLHHVSKIVYQIGDRHSRVSLEEKSCFPFLLANYDNKLLAIKKKRNGYSVFNKEFPYLEKINGIKILDFLKKYDTRNSRAPIKALLTRGAETLNFFGNVLELNNEQIGTTVIVTLSNGVTEKDFTLPLKSYEGRYKSIARLRDVFEDALEEKSFHKLSYWINKDIAYTAIPKMYSFSEFPTYKHHLKNTMEQFKNAEHLIIDIRYNSGGVRDILDFLAPYFIQKNESPWVANVAYVRTDEENFEDEASMNSRYLHAYESTYFKDKDRNAITEFQKQFKPNKKFDNSKFTKPYFMVFNQGNTPFKGAVYILMNERCFSAASVFATAFKGLQGVTLAGTTTDGSSGRSRRFQLNNSDISVKISTMLSFQRDGNPLDGFGTEPDVIIAPDLEMILENKDTQLTRLIEMINERKF